MEISLAFVMLGDGTMPSVDTLKSEFEQTWTASPKLGPVERADTAFTLSVGESHVAVALIGAPIPWSDLEGPCATSTFWPQAADVLKKHTHHLIVTVMGEAPPVERARLLTQVITALLAASESALGVYWGDAALVIGPELFRDFATGMLPDGLPLLLWVDIRVGRAEQGGSCGFTTGMTALGHMEIEVPNAPEEPKQLWQRLTGLVNYLLENGPVVKDGNTIGSDEHERIRVVYGNSTFGHSGQVMRLAYGPPAPAPPKARWKFFGRH